MLSTLGTSTFSTSNLATSFSNAAVGVSTLTGVLLSLSSKTALVLSSFNVTFSPSAVS